MSVRGDQVYSELRRQAGKARARAADVAVEIGRVRARVSELVAQRGTALMELTDEMMPELSERSIRKTFKGIRDELYDVLDRREARMDELASGIEQSDGELERLDGTIEEIRARLEAAGAEMAVLVQDAADRLTANDEFQELSKAAAYAEERLARNEERAAEIRREADEKLPAYESSRLFQYLVERKFGTGEYRSRGLTRRLDRWVADLVDFPAAKHSYDFLRVTPELVQAEVDRRKAEFDALMTRIEAIEAAVEAEIGLDVKRVEVEAIDAEEDQALVQRERVDAARSADIEELSMIERRDGRFQAEARNRFRQFLSDMRVSALERHARKTPDTDDDRLVSQIDRIDEALDDIEDQLEDLERKHDRREAQARDLERMVRRFRRENYHRSDSYFKGRDPRRDIERWSDGDLDGGDVWKTIERSHRRRRDTLDVMDSVGSVLSNPASQVLVNAMAHVVGGALGGALGGAARRGVGRRFGKTLGDIGGSIAGSIFRGGGGGGRSSGGSSKRGGFSIGDSF